MMNAVIFSSSPMLGEGFSSIIKRELSKIDVTSTHSLSYLSEQLTLSDTDLIILVLLASDVEKIYTEKFNVVRKTFPKAQIVVVDEGPVRGVGRIRHYFQAGAAGYASLTEGTDVFINCIESVLSGRKFLSPDGMDSFLIDYGKTPSRDIYHHLNLTTKELEIAKLLISGERVSQIAKVTNRKNSTISTIKKNIFRKTNTSNIINLKEILHQ